MKSLTEEQLFKGHGRLLPLNLWTKEEISAWIQELTADEAYYFQERLGILYAPTHPTIEQLELAMEDVDRFRIEKMTLERQHLTK